MPGDPTRDTVPPLSTVGETHGWRCLRARRMGECRTDAGAVDLREGRTDWEYGRCRCRCFDDGGDCFTHSAPGVGDGPTPEVGDTMPSLSAKNLDGDVSRSAT